MDSHEVTQIRAKQLFYHLKECFPDVPDAVVRSCITQAAYEKTRAEFLLKIESKKYLRTVSASRPQGLPRFNLQPNVDLPLMRTADNGRVQLIYPHSTTSVNVIVKSPTDQLPQVAKLSNGSQVQITIRPQGRVTSPENAERVQAQCQRRELLRRLLQESRQEVSLLSKKVDDLQKELARQQKQVPSNAYDFQRLKQEIRQLESECQSMIRELDPMRPSHPVVVASSSSSSATCEWSCAYCTFFNHPELAVCEQCERPRCRTITDLAGQLEVGSAVIPLPARSGNIRIQVRHRPRTLQTGYYEIV